MTEEDVSKFTTKRRSIGSDGELKWGGNDGEQWSDAVESSENITVTDDGTISSGSEIPDSGIVDSFERDDLEYYTGDTSQYEITSRWSAHGTGSVESYFYDDQSLYEVWSFDGLDWYPERGYRFRYVFQLDVEQSTGWENPRLNFRFGAQDELNFYEISVCPHTGGSTSNDPSLSVGKVSDGSVTKNESVTPSGLGSNATIYVEFDFTDLLNVVVYEDEFGGTVWESVSISDAEYDNGGIGWVTYWGSDGSNHEGYLNADYLHSPDV